MSTPFKMSGFSGFGNSPLTKKRKKKAFKFTKVGKFLGFGAGKKIFGGSKLGCGPRGCRN